MIKLAKLTEKGSFAFFFKFLVLYNVYMYNTLYVHDYYDRIVSCRYIYFEHARDNGSKKQDNSLIQQGVRSPPAG